MTVFEFFAKFLFEKFVLRYYQNRNKIQDFFLKTTSKFLKIVILSKVDKISLKEFINKLTKRVGQLS